MTCWNGEIVRIVFLIDAHDREVLAWHAVAGAGVSGSMVRDLMLQAVELRFATIQAPHAVEWLSDNGSPFTAKETLDFAAALGLVPCFTPVRNPESNGIAEAFVLPSSTHPICLMSADGRHSSHVAGCPVKRGQHQPHTCQVGDRVRSVGGLSQVPRTKQ